MHGISKSPAITSTADTIAQDTQSTGGVFSRLLSVLIRADRRYRDKRALETLNDRSLTDVGVSHQQRDQAFYGTYGRSPKNDAPAAIEPRLRS
jgi:uncharacterized protein YjiS (DUF1127 family)